MYLDSTESIEVQKIHSHASPIRRIPVTVPLRNRPSWVMSGAVCKVSLAMVPG